MARLPMLALATALALAPACGRAMSFVADPPFLFLSGRVVPDDLRTWRRTLERHEGAIKVVVLAHSPGGTSFVGREIGADIRARQLTTVVAGRCTSACASMFLGGERRHFSSRMNEAPTVLGFHGTYAGNDGTLRRDANQDYFLEMTGGRFAPELVARFTALEKRSGMLYLLHPSQRKQESDPLALVCQGDEDHTQRDSECERLKDVDALAQGVVTSWDAVVVPSPPRPRR